LNTLIIRYIFYLTSLGDAPSSQILVLEQDSIMYWNQDFYEKKKILYKKGDLIIVEKGWVMITNNRVKINSFGSRNIITYKIRYITDSNGIKLKGKPNPL